jgi:hypothetical protein
MNSFSLDAFDAKLKSALSLYNSFETPDANASKYPDIYDMVDYFFFLCQNNLAGPESESLFKTEEDEEGREPDDYILEQAETVLCEYRIIAYTDEKKSPVHKYIIMMSRAFDLKNGFTGPDEFPIDNYFDFLISADFK